MEYLYALGLVPAIAMYFVARSHYVSVRRRLRLPSSVLNAHFLPHLVGWGTAATLFWFFAVSVIAQVTDPGRITLLLLAPVAFAFGEGLGLIAWNREMHLQLMPRPLNGRA